MNRFTKYSWLLLLWLPSACSLALRFDPDGQPCDLTQGEACSAGYSCAVDANKHICVGDHSLKEGSACQLDRQCPEGQICPFCPSGPTCPLGELRRCAVPCPVKLAYDNQANCGPNRYCRPFYSYGQNSGKEASAAALVAACVADDGCTEGQVCQSEVLGVAGVCAPGSATARACVTSCEIPFSQGGGGQYSDNCGGGDGGVKAYCQPIGTIDAHRYLSCIATLEQTAAVDAPCNPFGAPCGRGALCFKGVCRAYCQTTANTQSCTSQVDSKCCALNLNASTTGIGYCSPNPACD